jgi:hypothetical protein
MPITYDSDTNRTDIEKFVPMYAASKAWAAHTKEYGVGALTVLGPQHIAGTAPGTLNDSDLTAMLTKNLTGASPAWGAPDANTIYAFFIPTGTIEDDGNGEKSCTDLDGYHASFVVNGVEVPYAVIDQCPGGFDQGATPLQQLTIVASHEIVEAVTDPYPDDVPGYAQTDDAHAVWTVATDGEVGDMCASADTYLWQPSDMTYAVQRMWSNAAAAAGHDPCGGDPTEPYYETVPAQPDAVTISWNQASWKTKGSKVPSSGTVTVALTVHADAAAGPFTVTIDDWSSVYTGGTACIQGTVPSTPVKDGDVIQATIKVLSYDTTTFGNNAAVFVVNTTPASGSGPTTYYYGLVAQ